jgi:hypothetical protein
LTKQAKEVLEGMNKRNIIKLRKNKLDQSRENGYYRFQDHKNGDVYANKRGRVLLPGEWA